MLTEEPLDTPFTNIIEMALGFCVPTSAFSAFVCADLVRVDVNVVPLSELGTTGLYTYVKPRFADLSKLTIALRCNFRTAWTLLVGRLTNRHVRTKPG